MSDEGYGGVNGWFPTMDAQFDERDECVLDVLAEISFGRQLHDCRKFAQRELNGIMVDIFFTHIRVNEGIHMDCIKWDDTHMVDMLRFLNPRGARVQIKYGEEHWRALPHCHETQETQIFWRLISMSPEVTKFMFRQRGRWVDFYLRFLKKGDFVFVVGQRQCLGYCRKYHMEEEKWVENMIIDISKRFSVDGESIMKDLEVGVKKKCEMLYRTLGSVVGFTGWDKIDRGGDYYNRFMRVRDRRETWSSSFIN